MLIYAGLHNGTETSICLGVQLVGMGSTCGVGVIGGSCGGGRPLGYIEPNACNAPNSCIGLYYVGGESCNEGDGVCTAPATETEPIGTIGRFSCNAPNIATPGLSCTDLTGYIGNEACSTTATEGGCRMVSGRIGDNACDSTDSCNGFSGYGDKVCRVDTGTKIS